MMKLEASIKLNAREEFFCLKLKSMLKELFAFLGYLS